MRRLLLLSLTALMPCGPALAGPGVEGDYDSPLGRIRVAGDGTSYRGTLVAPAGACRFEAGAPVLRGTLLDDSLAGELRVCLTGCPEPEAWARGVLLVGPAGLSGAVHVTPGCRAPTGKNGGVTLARVAPARSGTPAAPVSPTVKPAPRSAWAE